MVKSGKLKLSSKKIQKCKKIELKIINSKIKVKSKM